ncbi:hypothetical protein SAMN04487910_4031 [Aquimarina amphilecti]|uniref:Uncharacterized protein n=1 Tax=Aquimarina amphilecti TaxID=1038014 RepID=A0A1H7VBN0_AQUAM|nr:hypothetical protein [Aquimarina amphilecti]SEM06653.1 hypothetical protein SAMN04487910_4031 [Aquimarina amphilecti]
MRRKEEFSFLKKSLSKEISIKDKPCIHSSNDYKLYAINYSNVEMRFAEELENYKNYPELIDIDEFSMNYSFGYHSYNNIDDLQSKEAMFIEVKSYLKNLRMCA